MIAYEKIKNSSELEFAVFCIENVAAKLGVASMSRRCMNRRRSGAVSSTACVMKSRTCKYVSAQRKHCLCCILKGVKYYDSKSDFASEKI